MITPGENYYKLQDIFNLSVLTVYQPLYRSALHEDITEFEIIRVLTQKNVLKVPNHGGLRWFGNQALDLGD